MTRILLVHPGSSISTADVHTGIVGALERQGVEVFKFNLDARIESAGAWFKYMHDRAQRAERKKAASEERTARVLPKAGPSDMLAKAAEGILASALWNDVDWVLVVSGMYLHPDWVILLRKAGLRVGVMLTESPYDDVRQSTLVSLANVVWTNERTSEMFLRQWNSEVHYLPHAFDPARHYPAPVGPEWVDLPSHDVLFIGTGFQERIELLEAVDWSGIDLGIYGTWELLGRNSPLHAHIKGGYVDNAYAALMYKASAINLNIYRTSAGFGKYAPRINDAESLNPRALELAACGAFTISDARAEVSEVFGEGVPTYRDAQELGEQVRYYLAHPQERQRQAAALPFAVEGRTFDAVATQMLTALS